MRAPTSIACLVIAYGPLSMSARGEDTPAAAREQCRRGAAETAAGTRYENAGSVHPTPPAGLGTDPSTVSVPLMFGCSEQ